MTAHIWWYIPGFLAFVMVIATKIMERRRKRWHATCDHCHQPIHRHVVGGYWIYPDGGVILEDGHEWRGGLFYCNRCPKPKIDGRLYRVAKHSMIPINKAACDLERMRAGSDGLYQSPMDVPAPED